MRTDLLERKQDIEKWISEGQSKAFMARELGCNPKTINPLLERLNLEYKGNQSGKGLKKPKSNKMTLLEYLANSQDIQSNKVRIKLLEEGYKEHKCECCGKSSWLGQPIPLELHHLDGNRNNNNIENYQLLCPNCHALTDSYRGKNSVK
jgi:Zn finger protein HypA/HybF involved in hydrogenase expression